MSESDGPTARAIPPYPIRIYPPINYIISSKEKRRKKEHHPQVRAALAEDKRQREKYNVAEIITVLEIEENSRVCVVHELHIRSVVVTD